MSPSALAWESLGLPDSHQLSEHSPFVLEVCGIGVGALGDLVSYLLRPAIVSQPFPEMLLKGLPRLSEGPAGLADLLSRSLDPGFIE